MKAIKDAACELSDKEVPKIKNDYTNGLKTGIEYGFEKGVKFAQQWISVEDELPEEIHGFSDLVLTKNKFNNIELERYDWEFEHFNKIRYDNLEKGDGQVTHWRLIELK